MAHELKAFPLDLPTLQSLSSRLSCVAILPLYLNNVEKPYHPTPQFPKSKTAGMAWDAIQTSLFQLYHILKFPKMDVQAYQLASNCERISHQTPNNIRTRDGSHFVPDETLRHFGSQGGQRRWMFFSSRFLKQERFEFGRVLGLFLLLRLDGTLRHCSTNCFSFGSRTLKPCPRRRWQFIACRYIPL